MSDGHYHGYVEEVPTGTVYSQPFTFIAQADEWVYAYVAASDETPYQVSRGVVLHKSKGCDGTNMTICKNNGCDRIASSDTAGHPYGSGFYCHQCNYYKRWKRHERQSLVV